MTRNALLVAVATVLGTTTLAAQAPIPITQIVVGNGVTLKSFTPVDSFFVNPTQTVFTVTLNNSISGSATEYRVSHFADFRDANWQPYAARPPFSIPGEWFGPASSSTKQVTLYFQVRNKNPLAGRPISLIDGKTQVQPQFFFSDVIGRRVRIVYAG